MGNCKSEKLINEYRLADLMYRKGLSQRELAAKLGVTEASISRYMHHARNPRLGKLLELASVLGTTVDYLTGFEKERNGKINVILDEGAFPPERAHDVDAGMDIRSPKSLLIPAMGSGTIDTGVHIEIPDGYAGFLKSKSGLNVKQNITSEGVIDAGYQGSICVKLYNHGRTGYQVQRGDKISQLVILPVMLAEIEITDKFDVVTERNVGGFGSTGR